MYQLLKLAADVQHLKNASILANGIKALWRGGKYLVGNKMMGGARRGLLGLEKKFGNPANAAAASGNLRQSFGSMREARKAMMEPFRKLPQGVQTAARGVGTAVSGAKMSLPFVLPGMAYAQGARSGAGQVFDKAEQVTQDLANSPMKRLGLLLNGNALTDELRKIRKQNNL